MACVLEIIQLFFLFGFNTVLLICNGASATLELLKLLCHERPAVYSVKKDIERHEVKTSFASVYPNICMPIHVMICLLHQLENMIALVSQF